VPRFGIKLRRVHRNFRSERCGSQLCGSTLTTTFAFAFTAVSTSFTAVTTTFTPVTTPVTTHAAIANTWGFGG